MSPATLQLTAQANRYSMESPFAIGMNSRCGSFVNAGGRARSEVAAHRVARRLG